MPKTSFLVAAIMHLVLVDFLDGGGDGILAVGFIGQHAASVYDLAGPLRGLDRQGLAAVDLFHHFIKRRINHNFFPSIKSWYAFSLRDMRRVSAVRIASTWQAAVFKSSLTTK